MFHVLTMKKKDFPFAVYLANTMDWGMAEEDFEFNSKLEPKGCLVLYDDSTPIGVSTCISYGRVGWFGNLVVDENWRKKGAGTVLLKRSISYLKDHGVQTIGLYAYPHLTEFYEKFGFQPESNFIVLRGESFRFEEQTAVRKADSKDLSSLVSLDTQCFGADRSKLLRALLSEPKNLCYLHLRSAGIVGYVAAKVFGGMAEVGPLICQDKHRETATALVKTVLTNLAGSEIHIYIDEQHAEILDLLRNVGYEEDFRLVRMLLGPARAKSCMYFAESLERG
jgi:GNAT superfamily N-acetyltransferase